MEKINVFFLHGFLGRPSDWESVKSFLPKNINLCFYDVDYFHEPLLKPNTTFLNWGTRFNQWACKKNQCLGRNILVGYSLGGRLALHAFSDEPKIWEKVILISANMGFDDEETTENSNFDRRTRWQNDTQWSREFLKTPWNELLKKWNSQGVFTGGSQEPVRFESEYSRQDLAEALLTWSLARQKNARAVLSANWQKFIYIVGERDLKYVELLRELSTILPNLDVQIVSEASHRVLFEKPEAIAAKIIQAMESLDKK